METLIVLFKSRGWIMENEEKEVHEKEGSDVKPARTVVPKSYSLDTSSKISVQQSLYLIFVAWCVLLVVYGLVTHVEFFSLLLAVTILVVAIVGFVQCLIGKKN